MSDYNTRKSDTTIRVVTKMVDSIISSKSRTAPEKKIPRSRDYDIASTASDGSGSSNGSSTPQFGSLLQMQAYVGDQSEEDLVQQPAIQARGGVRAIESQESGTIILIGDVTNDVMWWL